MKIPTSALLVSLVACGAPQSDRFRIDAASLETADGHRYPWPTNGCRLETDPPSATYLSLFEPRTDLFTTQGAEADTFRTPCRQRLLVGYVGPISHLVVRFEGCEFASSKIRCCAGRLRADGPRPTGADSVRVLLACDPWQGF